MYSMIMLQQEAFFSGDVFWSSDDMHLAVGITTCNFKDTYSFDMEFCTEYRRRPIQAPKLHDWLVPVRLESA